MTGQILLTTVILLLSLPQGQSSAAEAAFNHAVELQQKGQWPEAAEAWRKFLELEPSHAGAHANLGAVLSRMGQYDEAVKSYDEALRLNPRLTDALFNLGVAHYRAGQFAKAAEALGRYLAARPESWQAEQILGLSFVELGRDEDAAPLLEAALKSNPGDVSALFGLGLAYLRLKRPEVKRMIDNLDATANGKPFAYLLKGQNYLADSDFQHAGEALEAAAKLSEDLPRLYFSLGVAYLRMERDREAIRAFERELQRLPRDYWTLYYLAFLREAEGELDAAREKAALALALQPRPADASALLGKVLLKQGKAAEAAPPLETAVAQNPNDANLRFQLARAYQQSGRRQDAAREFAEAQRLKDQAIEKERKGAAKP
ncbi:MAG: tetratricopeptide repeat protein [Blastocatellia bacterium]|nr:tetratricopeptide repeat protein [Blastocatellia bacterium]